MKLKTLFGALPLALTAFLLLPGASCSARPLGSENTLKTGDINLRDPFVLNYRNKYYLYGTRGALSGGSDSCGFDVYVSTDLKSWSKPHEVFHKTADFWADRNYWAPEVHFYNGKFYMLASFKADDKCRGTQFLEAASPMGPFRPCGDGPITPRDWDCLDGTLYIAKDGSPYLVYCHEYTQVHDGEIIAQQLSKNLDTVLGEPRLLFRASDAPWVKSVSGKSDFVTDGPFLYRCKGGGLLMLWSSFGAEGYAEAVAKSSDGEITGEWKQDGELLYDKNAGHGMVFTATDGTLYLIMHSPNTTSQERPVFFHLQDQDNTLRITTE